jgi:hypothetical protein
MPWECSDESSGLCSRTPVAGSLTSLQVTLLHSLFWLNAGHATPPYLHACTTRTKSDPLASHAHNHNPDHNYNQDHKSSRACDACQCAAHTRACKAIIASSCAPKICNITYSAQCAASTCSYSCTSTYLSFRRTCRLRVFRPMRPHVAVHSPHFCQVLTMQLMGQGCMLQGCIRRQLRKQ